MIWDFKSHCLTGLGTLSIERSFQDPVYAVSDGRSEITTANTSRTRILQGYLQIVVAYRCIISISTAALHDSPVSCVS